MAVFSYEALAPSGGRQRGVVDADTRRAAWQTLRTRGIYPTVLHEATGAERTRDRRVPAPVLAAAIRHLATLVAAGVPVSDALAAVAEQAPHAPLATACTLARARVQEGAPLAEALADSPRVFPPLFRDLVRAGEASGALAAVLERLAAYTEARAALRARLQAALTYPAVMTAAAAAVLGFLLVWVVPQVTQLFADTGARLPLATRLLVGASDVVARTWWIGLAASAGLVAGARAWAATPAGRERLDAAVLRLPVVGRLIRTAAMARLTRALATLLAGGLALEPALAIAGAVVGNRRLGAAVERVRLAVREGRALAVALAADAFPPLVVQMAAAGERSGDLTATLARAADAYERDLDTAVGALAALVEPALVLGMGAVVLALVTAILLPVFELSALAH